MSSKTYWKNEEWDAVCLELYRTHPIVTMSSSTLAGINSTDVIAAMKAVIPQERWRSSMNMTAVKPKLLERFKELRAHLQQMERENAEKAQRIEVERRKNDEAQAKRDLYAPLLKDIAAELFVHLRPMMDAYIDARMRPNDSPRNVTIAAHREAVRERKPKVGIIGMLPIQANDIQGRYPQFDFVFVENASRSADIKGKMTHADVIFGMTGKMGHAGETTLKAMPEAWANYRRVSGGPSAVRRSLDMWITERSQAQ